MWIKKIGEKVMNGNYLSYAELRNFVLSVREGNINDLQFVALLTAMETRNRLKGINLDETVNFVRALRIPKQVNLKHILCPAGTGGDPIKTINVSTPASVILSSGGVTVLKNGFKSVTSTCGSREILEGWGIDPFQKLDEVLKSAEEIGIGYYDFQNLIIKGNRSGFKSPLNYIGALSHPVQIDYKIIGCSNGEQFKVIERLADSLYKNYLLSYNKEIDEISTISQTEIVEKRNGEKRRYTFDPRSIEIVQDNYETLFSFRTPQENAEYVEGIFKGKESPRSQLIALNAGAGFYLTGRLDSIKEGYEFAKNLLSSGKVYNKLQEWRNFSRKNKNAL